MSQIPIEKQVFDKDQFGKVIDTEFSQLLNQQTEIPTPTFTLEDFFTLYDQLFYQIPKEGEADSHRYILQREADYLGVIIDQDDIQALLDEITALRQQVLDAQTALKCGKIKSLDFWKELWNPVALSRRKYSILQNSTERVGLNPTTFFIARTHRCETSAHPTAQLDQEGFKRHPPVGASCLLFWHGFAPS